MTKIRLLLGLMVLSVVAGAAAPKYVFVFIGDGMSTSQRMATEEYARATGYGPLAMNALPYYSYTRTSSANAIVTDSAASATAIACGEKTKNATLGLAPDGSRLESVAEVAKKKGMKVGIMTTVPIVHATPAGFYAHRKSRNDSYGIALDLLASKFDFFAGGAVYDKHDDKKHKEYRGNVYELAVKDGYAVAKDKASFAALKPGCGKAWGVFAKYGQPFAIDDDGVYPTLSEIVAKAVELLDGPQGFFIMAEGGKIDYCAHGNDAGTLVREVIAMDQAVKVALAFREKHPDETLVITTGDHETGAMALGCAAAGYDFRAALLAKQKCSAEVFSRRIAQAIEKNPDLAFEELQAIVEENYGLIFDKAKADTDEKKKLRLTSGEIKELQAAFENDVAFVKARKQETIRHDVKRRRVFAATCTRILASHVGISWGTHSHTVFPTLTTAQGCGAENFTGLIENTDISRRIKALIK